MDMIEMSALNYQLLGLGFIIGFLTFSIFYVIYKTAKYLKYKFTKKKEIKEQHGKH